jgi:hypothetical protein
MLTTAAQTTLSSLGNLWDIGLKAKVTEKNLSSFFFCYGSQRKIRMILKECEQREKVRGG